MSETRGSRILHLEDDTADAELITRALRQKDLASEVRVVSSRPDYLAALETEEFDLILSDNRVPDLDGLGALEIARRKCPSVPFLFVCGDFGGEQGAERLKAAGASACVLKSDLQRLVPAVQQSLRVSSDKDRADGGARYLRAMERLVTVVQELSLARDLETVMAIVRRAARELTGADGATFVLRDGDRCFYADENAIAPLWKGRRFPMSTCISGWAMLNRRSAVIEDIYSDPRIPHDAYRPTFVKSLATVPIRTLDPIGAIGNYWAEPHLPSPQEVKLLQALADTTAVALENVEVYTELEQRVRDRTAELKAANKELEAFSYSVSHDLRAPLRHIEGYSEMLVEDCADILTEEGKRHLERIRNATEDMGQLIDALLALSRTTRMPVARDKVDLSLMAREIAAELQTAAPDRQADFVIAEGLSADGDPQLLRIVLANLLSNAWKFSAKRARARIEMGTMTTPDGATAYYVRDDGAGFEMAYAQKLFGVFQRLHSESEFPGTGVGLATVQRIIHKHGGRIWAEAAVDQGASFYFTLA